MLTKDHTQRYMVHWTVHSCCWLIKMNMKVFKKQLKSHTCGKNECMSVSLQWRVKRYITTRE